MKHIKHAVPAALAAALVLPAAAGAHPSVYVDKAYVVPTSTPAAQVPADRAALEQPQWTQTRYVVTNHGFTYVLTESNGVPGNGMLDFKRAPSKYRNQTDFEGAGTGDGAGTPRARLRSEAATGAQAHATCRVPALLDAAAINAWQVTPESAEPFYDYVPFQRASAGLDEDPRRWRDVVLARTGVDLATIADAGAAKAACEGLPGATASAYTPADAVQSTAASFAAGTLKPVEDERDAAKAAQATAERAKADAERAKADAEAGRRTAEERAASARTAADAAEAARAAEEAARRAAQEQLAQLQLTAAPLTVTLASAQSRPADGVTVALTGPVLRATTVRLVVSEARARSMKLRSRVLGTATTSTGASGAARVTVKPSAAAAARMKRVQGPVAVTVEARAGDRFATATGTLAR